MQAYFDEADISSQHLNTNMFGQLSLTTTI